MSETMVYLVGAGTGSADLITLRGLSCIRRSRFLIYDRLLDRRLLDAAPPECEKIYVGKAAGAHYASQEEINALLLDRAGKGGVVVRLKGGDPYVFGRGGEEALCLQAAGIPFEVVPGVSSAIAGPCFAGIPVTHRDMARSVHIITAHTSAGGLTPQTLSQYAALDGTLVFLMGLSQVAAIARGLIAGGMDPRRPAAVISQAGSAAQQTLAAPLEELPLRAAQASLPSPALIVVGNTVQLHQKLDFLRQRPLFGRRILLTHSPRQQDGLRQTLEDAGAEVVSAPMLRIRPIPNALEGLWGHMERYTHTVFTSVNTVELFMAELARAGRDVRVFHGIRLCAVGPGTAQLLTKYGLRADLLPEEYTARGLLARMTEELTPTCRVLLPQAALAGPALQEGLERLCPVDRIPLYETLPPERPMTAEAFAAGGYDAATFSSASAVRNFHEAVGLELLKKTGTVPFSIGPAATAALRDLGAEGVESRRGTLVSLAERILEWYEVTNYKKSSPK